MPSIATKGFKLCSIPPPRPIVNSYWRPLIYVSFADPRTAARANKLNPIFHLVACEYPHAPCLPVSKIDALLMAGIRTFIDLTEPNELIPYECELTVHALKIGLPQEEIDTIEYHRFAIPDRCIPPSPHLIESVIAVLEDCERRGRKAAVHCRGGVGRTGMIVRVLASPKWCSPGWKGSFEVYRWEWRQVEKSKRFPRSPETGQQEDYVKGFKRIISRDPSPFSDVSSHGSITS